jgi:hypothetical protein
VSRYKFDRSRETIKVQDFYCGHWRSVAVQTVSEPENCQGAGFILRAGARVQVKELLQICLRCRSKSKKRDELIDFIDRVMVSEILNFDIFLNYFLYHQ